VEVTKNNLSFIDSPSKGRKVNPLCQLPDTSASAQYWRQQQKRW